jgi:uncharacterized membrane protein (Fun14 family)
MNSFIARHSDYINQLGFSGLLGFCCGIACKGISRQVATAIGVCFIGLQALSYYGYVQINYNKIQKDAVNVLDVNGDGKFDEKDLYTMWEKFKGAMSYNLPKGGCFSSGLFLGVYYG